MPPPSLWQASKIGTALAWHDLPLVITGLAVPVVAFVVIDEAEHEIADASASVPY